MGPSDINQPLTSTDDVSMYDSASGTEVTSGELYWADSEAGVRTLSVVIKPFSPGVWRVEKRYFISICSIRSNSSLMEAGQISHTTGTVTIVVCIALFLLFLQLFFFTLNSGRLSLWYQVPACAGLITRSWVRASLAPGCHVATMGQLLFAPWAWAYSTLHP